MKLGRRWGLIWTAHWRCAVCFRPIGFKKVLLCYVCWNKWHARAQRFKLELFIDASALLILIAVLMVAGCAKRIPSVQPPNVMGSAVLRLVGRYGFALACPVEGAVFSAAHVGVLRVASPYGLQSVSLNYRYSDDEGREGYVFGFRPSVAADIGVFLVSGTTRSYRSGARPDPGDTVAWGDYTLARWRLRRAEVVTVTAGHIIFDRPPTPGSSGGCLFNDDEEVLGIVIWGYGGHLGVAAALD